MKLILFKRDDDTIGLISVGPNEHLINEIAATDVPKDCIWTIIEADFLPEDKTFRDAWVWRNNKIEVDIELAKDQKRRLFRSLREPLLPSLDLQFMRAVEEQDTEKQKEIVSKKKALRDITAIEMPNDLKELKEFIPEILQSFSSQKP